MSRRPNGATAVHELGRTLIRKARKVERGVDHAASIAAWRHAYDVIASIADIDPNYASAAGDRALTANTTAWQMVKAPNTAGADLERALALATEAVAFSKRSNSSFLETLANAHFLLGNRNQAKLVCAEALDLAEKQLTPEAHKIKDHSAKFATVQ